jgi:hypothetical protein
MIQLPTQNKDYEVIWQCSPPEAKDRIDLALELVLKPIFENPNMFQDNKAPKTDSIQKCE